MGVASEALMAAATLNKYRSHHSINPNSRVVSSVFLLVHLSQRPLAGSRHSASCLCAHHTPSSSYFASTGRFYRVCYLAPLWHVLVFLTNAVPLIRVFIVVPRIP